MPTMHIPDRFQLVAILNYRPRRDENGALAHRLEDWHYWSGLPNDLKIVSRIRCYPWESIGRDSFFDDLVQEIRPLDSIKALDSRLAKLRAFQWCHKPFDGEDLVKLLTLFPDLDIVSVHVKKTEDHDKLLDCLSSRPATLKDVHIEGASLSWLFPLSQCQRLKLECFGVTNADEEKLKEALISAVAHGTKGQICPLQDLTVLIDECEAIISQALMADILQWVTGPTSTIVLQAKDDDVTTTTGRWVDDILWTMRYRKEIRQAPQRALPNNGRGYRKVLPSIQERQVG
ncbi:hypothetical protein HD553DRAFT_335677 [Filobasidium floriforme]|uniref:uncharacterized protein n=1 Tax=Filobasidium floriforme TaxID=5210 RepID=UPI001E8E01CD|nr:uncharacterized protein HD553DRAFT_335677 [Filobasidium floriforme]KAH8083551.1 hypothetical protein HD553DRAFT_335677 [Filobasidium floriforme]